MSKISKIVVVLIVIAVVIVIGTSLYYAANRPHNSDMEDAFQGIDAVYRITAGTDGTTYCHAFTMLDPIDNTTTDVGIFFARADWHTKYFGQWVYDLQYGVLWDADPDFLRMRGLDFDGWSPLPADLPDMDVSTLIFQLRSDHGNYTRYGWILPPA